MGVSWFIAAILVGTRGRSGDVYLEGMCWISAVAYTVSAALSKEK